MQISAIEPITKDRSRITLDSGESFILYKGEIRLLRLKEETELLPEVYNQIMTAILPKRAKLRLMNLLKTKSYTEYQLRKKLVEGGYPDSVTDIAVDYIKSYGYINDRQYAIDFIKSQSTGHSKKEIYLKLSQKGIHKETLDAAFNEVYGEYKDACIDSPTDEIAVIRKTLLKRGFSGEETYEERQKMLAYFYRRGFEMDKVYAAMDEIKEYRN